MSKTIAILMPGDMGHGCGKAFKNNNFIGLLFLLALLIEKYNIFI